jgi:hypothetical protein
MMEKFSVRMEELERKVANESHNIGGPLSQVTATSDVFCYEEQDGRMASRTEERATHDESRSSNTGRPNSNSLLSNNTNDQGPPVLTGEDVNTGGQPNTNSQLHELDRAPLAFAGEDINMSRRPMNNINQPEQAQAPLAGEDVNMGGQAMDTGRPEDVRWGKQRKRPLDEDEEDFGQYDEDDGVDDSDPEIVSIVHILEHRVTDCPKKEMGDGSRSSVPKPIFRFQRPRGGAGPQLQFDPQTSTTANPVPNIPNITPSTLQSLGMTSEQVAAIAKIVMAVQNIPKPDTPSRSRAMNVSGTIKEQNRREKNPRRRVLVVRVQSPQHKRDLTVSIDCCQAPHEYPAENRTRPRYPMVFTAN